MAPGDFSRTDGKQRAVSAQPGGYVVVGSSIEHFEALLIESGTAALEDFFILDDNITRWQVRVPIMVIPDGATVVKTVAMAAPANMGWNDSADAALWAIDEVHVEEDTGTRELFLVPHVAVGGTECELGRIAYHLTAYIQSRKYIAYPEAIVELELA